ncbi:MAG: hypothetical protein IKV29_03585 [Alistipes sp.]|nr:hypothetical protein [Alistipes sp.]
MIRKGLTSILLIAIGLLATVAIGECSNIASAQESAKTSRPKIKSIDKELTTLLLASRNCSEGFSATDSLQRVFIKRLEHYLTYPETYNNDMPKLQNHVRITSFPETKTKFYSFWIYGGGTMSDDKNYFQYMSSDGEVDYIPFLNDVRYPRGIVEIWDFKHGDTNYYVLKGYCRGMSSSWYYSIAVVSIEDGEITYHPEFLPKTFGFVPSVEEYFTYDESGQIDGQEERPGYFMNVCGTENANVNVDFDFDPKTLTVTVWDDADTTYSRTGATTKSEWKLSFERGKLVGSISGDFDGDGNEDRGEAYYLNSITGTATDNDDIYIGPEDNYHMEFSGNISQIDGQDLGIISELTNEGDLDGDGGDELGLWTTAGMTLNGSYIVYTYKDGVWKELLSIGHNPNWNDCDYQDLVCKHPTKSNWLIIKEVICGDGKVRDRIIDINRVLSRSFCYEYLNFEDNYVYIEGWKRESTLKFRHNHLTYHDVVLRISHCDCEPFTFYGGCTYKGDRYAGNRVKYPYDHYATFVTAPDDLFFFADLDFDGTKELITGLIPEAGSQRYCEGFTLIYRLEDGKYRDATAEFHAKSEVFKMIDPTGWSIDTKTREIYHYNIAGFYHNVDVYKFEDGNYYYHRRIECTFEQSEPERYAHIKVHDKDGKKICYFEVSKEDYEDNWWGYVRYSHLNKQ